MSILMKYLEVIKPFCFFFSYLDEPACSTDFWHLYLNTNAPRGTLQSSITQESACRDGCKASATCQGFTYNADSRECRFHIDGVPDVPELGAQTNTRHYRNCDAPIGEGAICWLS